MQPTFSIHASLTLDDLHKLNSTSYFLSLSPESKKRVEICRHYLDEAVKQSKTPVYGVNTGFGSLYHKQVPDNQVEQLQENLVLSHACGTGDEVPTEIVKWMLLLKAHSLAYGNSGVQVDTVQQLLNLYNHNIFPVVYTMGSLGASGDLAPLAHLTLPLMGKGKVRVGDTVQESEAVWKKNRWNIISWKSKEGLAMLNGTQFMSAYGVYALLNANKLVTLSNKIAALSLDAFDGRIEPFDEKIQRVRPHQGQVEVAKKVQAYLIGSELIRQPKQHIQDPYSFRCVPQVHGASADAVNYFSQTILTEINSVTDNPVVFPEEQEIISAGNFHGQPLALAFDFLSIALAELGSISERRTFQLISGARGLPHYLLKETGIHSGLMIPQYTAASLVSQNKQLCSPASVDSIVSSNGQEDHVSMGANAATKAYRVIQNLYSILAIELMTAAQALHFRRPLKTSPMLETWISDYREEVPILERDRLLHDDIRKTELFLKNEP